MKLTFLLLGIAVISMTFGACKNRRHGKALVAEPVCVPVQTGYGYTK